MSCNNYQSYYNSLYGYPSSYCCCKVKCNPCQTVVCQPQCNQQCVVSCPTPCAPICNNVTYIAGIPTANTIPSGGVAIPVGTIIPPGTTTVPAGTVTVINGYTGVPTSNSGGIIPNNGFFTVPVSGRYIVSAYVCFSTVAISATTNVDALYIYIVSAATGLVTLAAVDSRSPVVGLPTCINIATDVDLNPGDAIFIAATQTNSTAASISTVAGSGRIAITRVNC